MTADPIDLPALLDRIKPLMEAAKRCALGKEGRPMTARTAKVGDPVWHLHHERLCEFLVEPLKNRIAYVKAHKPQNEIATRLRWMTPVRGQLPAALVEAGTALVEAGTALVEAGTALDKASVAYDKASVAYDKTWVAYDKARAAYDTEYHDALPALDRLHAEEHPGCPWNGTTLVFAEAER